LYAALFLNLFIYFLFLEVNLYCIFGLVLAPGELSSVFNASGIEVKGGGEARGEGCQLIRELITNQNSPIFRYPFFWALAI